MKQFNKMKQLAESEQFKDIACANQLIADLCEEVLSKMETIKQLENRPVVYPHYCYLAIPYEPGSDSILFRKRDEAELFRAAQGSANRYRVKTIELFESHKKVMLKREFQFLR
ncbi:hypothetical protein [Bacillus toyonensis]|uniref:hypothetical protein n=1 Tax=Bacillus toyonensis TaxID=155322 RepID=UPI002E1F1BAD|nr:hypothetical protein [Bacillus toyonensis]